MPDNPISQTEWTLVQRYLIGPVTPAETDAAQAVVQREPRLQALVDVLQTTAPVMDSPIVDLGSLKRRIDATRMIAPSSTMRLRGFKAQPLLWGGAIGILMAVLIGSWVEKHRPGAVGDTGRVWTVYRTAPGERATIELSDGTTVTLNVASRLEIPERFGDRTRTVRLHGEADFQVVHTTDRPFTVEADGVRSTVLGTEFSVRAYQPTEVRVAVRSGRVAVDRAILGASDVAYVTANAATLTVARHQRLNDLFAFTTGRLVLPDVRLRDAIPALNRWYDVDIRLGNSTLGDRPIDAVLFSGSIGDLVEALRTTLGVQVVQNGRTLTLFPR
jgi:transmembrane sensor